MRDVYELNLPAGPDLPDLMTGSVTFIGTATVLIKYAGFTILTDPNFIHMHEKVSIGYGTMHATRLTNPAMNIRDLPPVDLIILSHFHRDHFDQVAERELDKSIPIVTTAGASKELAGRGFHGVYPLSTWSLFSVHKGGARLRITPAPGRHAPALADLVMPEVMGSILEFEMPAGQNLYRMYITGDTLVFDDIKEIPGRYPDIDLALLHLGGASVLGMTVTMDGKQGVEMIRIVQPHLSIPIHYNDYDVFKSPLSDFQHEVLKAGFEDRVHYIHHGETYGFFVSSSRISPAEVVG